MERDDEFTTLIRAASVSEMPALPVDLESRVMVEVARRTIERSRRRARRGVVASLTGLAMLLVGSIAALVAWFPILMPAFTNMSWLEKLRIPEPKFLNGLGVAAESAAHEPFLEQWGGLILLGLLVGGAIGFIYYLNSLFSNDYKPTDRTAG